MFMDELYSCGYMRFYVSKIVSNFENNGKILIDEKNVIATDEKSR